AEDGIRDLIVTGVQTCALPILKRTNSTPGTTGANGARYFSLCVVARAPNVLPWKACSRARIRHFGSFPSAQLAFAYARASFRAPSHASVPLLVKKARSMPEIFLCAAARRPWYSWKKRFDVCTSSFACFAITFVSAGCA